MDVGKVVSFLVNDEQIKIPKRFQDFTTLERANR